MAKKRKRQDEIKEEREYKPPEFDRRDFVKTEVSVSKAAMMAAVFSIPMGLAAMFVMPVGGVGGGLLTGLAGMGILWFLLPKLGVDVLPFKPMNWGAILSTYFLVFLTVWVVLCNPPFNDFASPEIRHVRVGWDQGGNMTWENVTAAGLGDSLRLQMPANVTNITVRAQVTDNVRVEPGSVMFARDSLDPPEITGPLERDGVKYIYEAEFDNVAAGNSFTITASDVNGNHAEYRFDIVA